MNEQIIKDLMMNLWRKSANIKEKYVLMPGEIDKNIIELEIRFDNFFRLMKNRMIMGCFRYGPISDKTTMSYNVLQELQKRLKRFEESGNKEFLLDAANMLFLEFEFSKHPKAHFNSVDDGEHA